MSIFRTWPEQNYQVQRNECLVPNPLPPPPRFPKELHSLTWATSVLLQVLTNHALRTCPDSFLSHLCYPETCLFSLCSPFQHREQKGEERSWKRSVVRRAAGAGWGGTFEGTCMCWEEVGWNESLSKRAPVSPTTSNSISAPRRKIKITVCGMKRWQWLWIQLCYRNLEITLPFEAC